jgi:hypothetical protein
MKKLLISTLCVSALALVACDKKTDVHSTTTESSSLTASAPVSYSDNNIADMRHDIEQIQKLSNEKAQDALKFQTDVTQSAQSGDKAALEKVIQQMSTFVGEFNQSLDALSLKSTEGDKIRNQMKEVNNISIELVESSMTTPPNIEKVTTLQKKSVEIQQELLKEMQELQTKISAK